MSFPLGEEWIIERMALIIGVMEKEEIFKYKCIKSLTENNR